MMQLIGREHAWRPSNAGIYICPSKHTGYRVSNNLAQILKPTCCHDPFCSQNPRHPIVRSPLKATVVEHTPLHFPLSVHAHTHRTHPPRQRPSLFTPLRSVSFEMGWNCSLKSVTSIGEIDPLLLTVYNSPPPRPKPPPQPWQKRGAQPSS